MEFIDISKWNSVFNWQKAANKGVAGAYLKASGCGDGGNYEDFRFKENSASCTLSYKGAYHFFDYRKDGADQAKYFLDKSGNFGNLRGVIDLEDNSGSGWAKLSSMYGTALKNAFAFVTEYKLETGYLPALYVSSYLTTQKDLLGKYMLRNFHECPLWVAHYTTGIPRFGGWSNYAIWQWSSTGDGYVYGNGGTGNPYIDLNIVNDLSALLKPGIITEDEPVVIEPELSDAEKLTKLWNAHPELH